MSKTYLSIHASGEGKLGVSICLVTNGVCQQGVLMTDFDYNGKSVCERSEVPFSEFDSFEVDEHEVMLIKSWCEPEWSEYEC